MKLLKPIGLWLGLLLLSIALTTFSWSIVANQTFGGSSKVLGWLDEADSYSQLVNSIGSLQIEVSGEGTDKQQLDTDTILAAAEESVDPGQVKVWTTDVVNGLYRWLDGSSDVPVFTVDITETKQAFANNLSSRLLDKYEALPACQSESDISLASKNPLGAGCQLNTAVYQSSVEQVKQDIIENEDFLGKDVYDASSLGFDEESGSLGHGLAWAPEVYQRGRKLPMYMIVLAITASLVVITSSPNRLTGLRRVSSRLISSSLAGLLGIAISLFTLKLMTGSIVSGTGGSSAITDILTPLADQIVVDMSIYGGLVAALMMSVGVVLRVIVSKRSRVAKTTANTT